MINDLTLTLGWHSLGRLRAGDLVHVRTPGSWMSRITRWWGRRKGEAPTWASHSGMIADSANDVPTVLEARWSVVERPLTAYEGKSRVAITRCPHVDLRDGRELVEAGRRHLGQKYGWWKLLHHSAGRPDLISNPDRPICSYLVAHLYGLVIPQDFGMPANEAQPDDLLDYSIHNGWPLVWCDSPETRDELAFIYHERDDFVRQLETKIA